MSYRVEYPSFRPETEAFENKNHTFHFLLLFLLLTGLFWPEGREVLCRLLWPFDPELTAQAGAAFLDAPSLGLAVESFCAVMAGGTGRVP